ncbi:MAG: inorganic phosphate transporter [Rhodobacteraceae bacterium]|nr:inorganic phosphate transporter [Paracoccaceae bacterium]
MEVSIVIILAMAIVAGLYMAWAIGANDVANSMGTSVGSGAITVGVAILIAGVFEFLGAFLAGGEVTSTIRKGIIDSEVLEHDPNLLVVGMLAALLAASVWLIIASAFGWPVSTTHTIIGAIIGFAVVAIGIEAVQWWDVAAIAASWVVTPALAGVISFLLVLSVQRLIFDKSDPAHYARRYVPFYIFAAVFVTAAVTFVKGLKHVGLDLSLSMALLYSVLTAGIVAGASGLVINRLRFQRLESTVEGQSRFNDVERVFGILMIVTASGMAFAHGSNDVANAIGPVAAIIGVVSTGGVAAKSAIPVWVLLLGAGGIVIGLATFGYKVMATIGRKITELTPSRGFAAEFAAASTVVIASGTGLPVSTTQTLVGAVLGVGLAEA